MGDDALLGAEQLGVLQGAWWHFVFPGVALALSVAALVFINYGVDELANPRLRRRKARGDRSGAGRRARDRPVETEVLLELDDLVVDYLEADGRSAPSTTST